MPVKDAVQGLGCPRCGGMVPVPEGQALVICPYCEQRSLVASGAEPARLGAGSGGAESGAGNDITGVRGSSSLVSSTPVNAAAQDDLIPDEMAAERVGLRRYQAPLKISRDQAVSALRTFLSGKVQVARDAANSAELSEAFLVHLPFWAVWGRGVAWAFGQQKVGSGKNSRYEPREKNYSGDLDWNCPACEVGEFGVRQVSLKSCPLGPFNPDDLHRSGMVFEPVGSARQALNDAEAEFADQLRDKVSMSRLNQMFARVIRPRLGLVYYPLWVLRYLYRGRSFQIVVDGFNGDVLYGKAPGSVGYRAAMLVGGMAVGAFLTVDVPALILQASVRSSDSDDNIFGIALIAFVLGLGVIWNAFRTFRYAEHYEYHRYGRAKGRGFFRSMTGDLPGGLSKAIGTIKELQ